MRGPSGIEVQGWTTPSDALKLANGQEGMLFRSRENFTDQVNVTAVSVPLNRLLHAYPSGNGDNLIIRAVP